MDTKGGNLRCGGDGGVLNWAIGIDMYTVMCIKLMTDLKKMWLLEKKKRKSGKESRVVKQAGRGLPLTGD